MWIKILKYVVVAAQAVGLDAKIKAWVQKKLEKKMNKLADQALEAALVADSLDKPKEPK